MLFDILKVFIENAYELLMLNDCVYSKTLYILMTKHWYTKLGILFHHFIWLPFLINDWIGAMVHRTIYITIYNTSKACPKFTTYHGWCVALCHCLRHFLNYSCCFNEILRKAVDSEYINIMHVNWQLSLNVISQVLQHIASITVRGPK